MSQGNITYKISPSDSCEAGNEADDVKPHYAALRLWTLRKYGLTPETYEAKCVAQQGVCAICGKAETSTRDGRVKRLAVDHSRVTGRIRDLLCCRCNQAIGLLFEDPTIIKQAAAYIERHQAAVAGAGAALEAVFERVPSVLLPVRGEVA